MREPAAKFVLENPAYQQAMAQLELELCRAFVRTGLRDAETREQLYRLSRCKKVFERILTAILSDEAIDIVRMLKAEQRERRAKRT